MKNNIYNIVFVCHGNICRSPMAEFVMRDLAEKKGFSDKISICSRATSYEEFGNPVHRGTVAKLSENGISCKGKRAEVVSKKDIEESDAILYMDGLNYRNLERIMRGHGANFYTENISKCKCLKEYTGRGGDIADPWYTGNFDLTWDDVYDGCVGLMEEIVFKGL